MPLENPLNFCRPCGQDFCSVELFDRHRVGVHDYTYDEGLRQSPPKTNGRRCLSVDAMREKGWQLDARGRWSDPERSNRRAAALAGSNGPGVSPTPRS